MTSVHDDIRTKGEDGRFPSLIYAGSEQDSEHFAHPTTSQS
jgi:hypothetical protein